MFNFFKKKQQDTQPEEQQIETPEEEKPEAVAELIYTVDKEGDTWVECTWNSEVKSSAHLYFAELLDKVCSGETLDDALNYVRDGLESEGRLEELEDIMKFMLDAHKERLTATFANMMMTGDGGQGNVEDSLVVKPSDILRNHPHVQ
tara:strand:+ start:1395 stop:1835 length:441 start_codon:yes stop_codon:yes gene_type:complete